MTFSSITSLEQQERSGTASLSTPTWGWRCRRACLWPLTRRWSSWCRQEVLMLVWTCFQCAVEERRPWLMSCHSYQGPSENLVSLHCYVSSFNFRTFYVAFRQPHQGTDIFWIQFTRKSWIAVLLVVFVFQGITLAVDFSSQIMRKNARKGVTSYLDLLRWEHKWLGALLPLDLSLLLSWPIHALVQKSHEPEPEQHTQRFIFIVGFFFFFLLFNYFTANIITTLQLARSIKDVPEVMTE